MRGILEVVCSPPKKENEIGSGILSTEREKLENKKN
jgi:hypothetical protein